MALVVECPTDQKLCWYVKNVENRTQHNSGQEFLSPKTKYFAQDCSNAEFHTFVRNVDTTHASQFFFLIRRDGQIASSQYFIRFMAIQKYQEISFMSSGLQVPGQMIRNTYISIIINQIKR